MDVELASVRNKQWATTHHTREHLSVFEENPKMRKDAHEHLQRCSSSSLNKTQRSTKNTKMLTRKGRVEDRASAIQFGGRVAFEYHNTPDGKRFQVKACPKWWGVRPGVWAWRRWRPAREADR
jgi:hypothetical protein